MAIFLGTPDEYRKHRAAQRNRNPRRAEVARETKEEREARRTKALKETQTKGPAIGQATTGKTRLGLRASGGSNTPRSNPKRSSGTKERSRPRLTITRSQRRQAKAVEKGGLGARVSGSGNQPRANPRGNELGAKSSGTKASTPRAKPPSSAKASTPTPRSKPKKAMLRGAAPSGSKSATPRTNPRGSHQEVSTEGMSFKKAFAASRKAGQKEFTWRGKRYNTKVK